MIVTCGGVDDLAAVQAALNLGGEVVLTGSACALPNFAQLTQPRTHVVLDCPVNAGGSVAFCVTGENCSIEGNHGMLPINAAGVGIQLGTSSILGRKFRLKRTQINSQSTGLNIISGAGLRMDDVHFNGVPGARTHAIRARNIDTIFADKIIAEEHDHGVRIYEGVFNVQFGSLILDRLNPSYGLGLWVEPGTSAGAGNIEIANFWASQGNYAVALNAASGSVDAILIGNGLYTGFSHNAHSLVGSPTNFKRANEVFK